jgi:hypothetical protein
MCRVQDSGLCPSTLVQKEYTSCTLFFSVLRRTFFALQK